MSKTKPNSNPNRICIAAAPHIDGPEKQCNENFEIEENVDSCAAGRIDAKRCLKCNELFDFDIIR